MKCKVKIKLEYVQIIITVLENQGVKIELKICLRYKEEITFNKKCIITFCDRVEILF